MELIKVVPSKIDKLSPCYQCHGKKVRHYCLPRKVETKITTNKKHHYIIEHNGVEFYSYELNAMLTEFNFDISKIHNITINNKSLSFTTIYGKYTVGSLFEVSDFNN